MSVRCLPPVAAPAPLRDLLSAAAAAARPGSALDGAAREMRDALGVRHLWLVSSGRAALTLILRALALRSDRRAVIIPGYTCFSVPASIARAGLDVVPCDVDPGTLDFDFEQLEQLAARERPLCVVPTHMFGLPADVERTRAVCARHRAVVVEDAAQAFGFERDGRWLGTLGDVGFFSFARGKTIAAGGGGAIVTDSAELAAAIEAEYVGLPPSSPARGLVALVEAALISLLIRPWLYGIPARLPFLGLGETVYSTSFTLARVSGVQAGLLRSWRERAPQMNADREAKARSLSGKAGAGPYLGGPCLRLPVLCASREQRDRLVERGRRAGLGFSLMYPSAVTGIAEIAAGLHGLRCPNAEDIAARLLTVPVHCLVTPGDLEAIGLLLSEELAAAEA